MIVFFYVKKHNTLQDLIYFYVLVMSKCYQKYNEADSFTFITFYIG